MSAVVRRGGLVVEFGISQMSECEGEFLEAAVLHLFIHRPTETCECRLWELENQVERVFVILDPLLTNDKLDHGRLRVKRVDGRPMELTDQENRLYAAMGVELGLYPLYQSERL
jgi:hypothetical protein